MHGTALGLVLRRASPSDGHLLYRWRMDPSTRAASHQSGPIELAAHLAWLKAALSNPRREIYIAEVDGVPVGTVRLDHESDVSEVSWTVAPEARGRGIGSSMVAMASASVSCALRAEIKPGNAASIRIAEAAGLRFEGEERGVLRYKREPLPRVR